MTKRRSPESHLSLLTQQVLYLPPRCGRSAILSQRRLSRNLRNLMHLVWNPQRRACLLLRIAIRRLREGPRNLKRWSTASRRRATCRPNYNVTSLSWLLIPHIQVILRTKQGRNQLHHGYKCRVQTCASIYARCMIEVQCPSEVARLTRTVSRSWLLHLRCAMEWPILRLTTRWWRLTLPSSTSVPAQWSTSANLEQV